VDNAGQHHPSRMQRLIIEERLYPRFEESTEAGGADGIDTPVLSNIRRNPVQCPHSATASGRSSAQLPSSGRNSAHSSSAYPSGRRHSAQFSPDEHVDRGFERFPLQDTSTLEYAGNDSGTSRQTIIQRSSPDPSSTDRTRCRAIPEGGMRKHLIVLYTL
jgi:hypothetical protein